MLLPNLLYQFFFASPPRRPVDPEKGTSGEPDPNANAQGAPASGPGVRDASETPNTIEPQTGDTEAFLATIDDEDGDDEIIHQLEQEEYPDELVRPRRRFKRFSTFSSFSTISTVPTGLSSAWTRFKNVLDPRTSPADFESYVPHYRHLPILSGVVIPFSILLEIPGLTESWYIRTEANEVVDQKPNTTILDIGLAFSIAFAVMANACLIFRFLEKKVKYTTLMCIALLTIHDFINIIALLIFGVEHRFDDGFTYGQAFWTTVCSTSVSSFVNVTLIVDLVQTPDFANSGSGLTRKQRTLVICAISLMTYIAFGALIQTFLTNLTFLDALYFTVVSIETIGFGDIVPINTGGRIFTCLYSIFGIVNLALTVGLIRETVLEGIEVGYRKRVKAARLRRKTLNLERRVFERWRAAIEWRLNKARKPVWVKDGPAAHHHSSLFMRIFDKVWPWPTGNGKFFRYKYTVGHGDNPHPHGMHLNLEALSWPQLEAAAMEAGVPLRNLLPVGFKVNKPARNNDADPRDGEEDDRNPSMHRPHIVPPEFTDIPLTHARLGRMIVMLGNFGLAVDRSSFAPVPKAAKLPPLQVTRDSKVNSRLNRSVTEHYKGIRASMAKEEKRAFYARFSLVWIVFIVFWLVGSGIFMVTEGWSYGNALYFCVIAFTTIGYGDFTPETPAGRCIFVFWALLGVATMTILISILSEAYSSRYQRAFHSSAFAQVVKRYRERTRETAKEPRTVSTSLTLAPPRQPDVISPSETVASPKSIDDALSDSRKRAEVQLEALPRQVLQHARRFNEHVQYLIESEAPDKTKEAVPDGLKQLMNDLAGVERLGERIKEEILQDTNARHTLLAISIENALRKIIEIAEEAIEAVEERDKLTELRSPTENDT